MPGDVVAVVMSRLGALHAHCHAVRPPTALSPGAVKSRSFRPTVRLSGMRVVLGWSLLRNSRPGRSPKPGSESPLEGPASGREATRKAVCLPALGGAACLLATQRTLTSRCTAAPPASAVLFLDTSRTWRPHLDTFGRQLGTAFKLVASAIG